MLKHGLLNVHAWGGGGLTVIRQKKMLISKHIILCYQIFWRKMQKFKISWQINQGGLSRDCTVDDTLMVICTTDCTVGDTLWHSDTLGQQEIIGETFSQYLILIRGGNYWEIFHEKYWYFSVFFMKNFSIISRWVHCTDFIWSGLVWLLLRKVRVAQLILHWYTVTTAPSYSPHGVTSWQIIFYIEQKFNN